MSNRIVPADGLCSHSVTLRWRHNGHDGVSNHQPHYCLLNRLFGCRSKKTSKLRVTGLCAGNSPGTGEFPAQMASNAENVSIWWCNHKLIDPGRCSSIVTYVIFKHVVVSDIKISLGEIAFSGVPMDLIDDKSTLVQVMAWCRQATNLHLRQCWPRSMSPYCVTGPQWILIHNHVHASVHIVPTVLASIFVSLFISAPPFRKII